MAQNKRDQMYLSFSNHYHSKYFQNNVRLWPQLLPLCPDPLSQVSPCCQLFGRLSMLNLQWSPVVKEITLISCLAKYKKRNYKTGPP